MPDGLIDWLDAALFLVSSTAVFPPLLAKGGTDGNLDFTKNFLERVADLIDLQTGQPHEVAGPALVAALEDTLSQALGDTAIGQYVPSGSGGANAGLGFEGTSRCNPWDLVLAVEGTVVFAAAAVRRCGRRLPGGMAYPFTVRMLATGYESSSAADEEEGKDGNTRGEMWLPMWETPVRLPELKALLNEGRANVSGRPVRHTVDFARAVSTLGVDRGIASFQRYAFHVRKGSTALATPLERFRVREQPTVRLLDEIDSWLDAFRRRAASDRAPGAARRALGVLEEAIVDLCRRGGPDRVQAVLVALGGCERTMARSIRWATDPKHRLTPVPPLRPQWLTEADDGSPELRLAAALSSVAATQRNEYFPLRRNLEPVTARVTRRGLRVEWDPSSDRDVVFTGSDLAAALNGVLARRLILFEQRAAESYPDRATQPARLAHVAAFIERRIDDERLVALLWGAILIDWPSCDRPTFDTPVGGPAPPALYGLLKLCFPGASAADEPIPIVPRIHRVAAFGDGADASRAAARRLRASGLSPAVDLVHQSGDEARRTAAAVLFPLAPGSLARIRDTVLRPTTHPGELTP
jgi:CRISPR-associated protein Csx17